MFSVGESIVGEPGGMIGGGLFGIVGGFMGRHLIYKFFPKYGGHLEKRNETDEVSEELSEENYISGLDQTPQGGVAEETEKPLHMRWFKFWTYVWLPFCIIMHCFYALDPTNPVIWNTYFGLLAIIYVPSIIGLHKKKKWGWKLNLAVITGHTFIVTFVYYYANRYMDMWGLYRGNPPDSLTHTLWLLWIIVWLLVYAAQYLYWKRREHLFA